MPVCGACVCGGHSEQLSTPPSLKDPLAHWRHDRVTTSQRRPLYCPGVHRVPASICERLQSRPRESATPLPRRSPLRTELPALSYSFSGRRPMNKRLTTPGVRAVPGAESDFIDDAKPTNDEWFRASQWSAVRALVRSSYPQITPGCHGWAGIHADRTRSRRGASCHPGTDPKVVDGDDAATAA